MMSKNIDWFCYNTNYETWSRVITRMGGLDNPYQIEIDLTPYKDEESRTKHTKLIKKCNVRYHVTPNWDSDIWTHHLPESVVIELEKMLTPVQFELLVHADVLSMIDMERLATKEIGSYSLVDVCKPVKKLFICKQTTQNTVTNKSVSEEEFRNDILDLPALYVQYELISGMVDKQALNFLSIHVLFDPRDGGMMTQVHTKETNIYNVDYECESKDIDGWLKISKSLVDQATFDNETLHKDTREQFKTFLDQVKVVLEHRIILETSLV